jgi:hypothetical protein
MNTKRISTVLLLILVAASCASVGGQRTVPTADRVATASGMDPDALLNGRGLYTRNCMDCHRQYFPEEYTPAAWKSIIPAMGDRAGLSELETHNVLLFLSEASRMTRQD